MLGITGIADFAEITHKRTTSVRELVQVLFAEQHSSSALQALYDFGIFRWNTIFEQSAGSRGANTSSVDHIF